MSLGGWDMVDVNIVIIELQGRKSSRGHPGISGIR